MPQSRSTGTDTDAALRRVPDADRRDPWQRPDGIAGVPRLHEVRTTPRRYGVRWNQRSVTPLSATQLRISLPLLGPTPPADFGYRIAQRLMTALGTDPIASRFGPITVAANVSILGTSDQLTMVVSTRPQQLGRPFDAALLSTPLELALRVLSNEDDTFHAERAPRDAESGSAR